VFTGKGDAPLIQVALDYVSRKRLRHYEVVGDEAGLCWDIAGTLDSIAPAGRSSVLASPGGFDVAQSYVDMVDRIASAIDGHWPEPLQTLEDGIASTRLALQARDQGTRQGENT
jgi:predicted dehydrogenase